MGYHDFFELCIKMSLQATLLIGIIMIFRVFTRKLPKIYGCMLWGLVLIRLLCPVFIESSFSLIPQMAGKGDTAFFQQRRPAFMENSSENAIDSVISYSGTAAQMTPAKSISSVQTASGISGRADRSAGDILSLLWMGGVAGMAIWQLFRYIRMRKLLMTAVRTEEGVWECEGAASPFVMGCIKPRIYLPFGITGIERAFIISHERSHIRHFDPQLRVAEIAALCLHWWNPFVWLAVYTMNKDREMLCDEAVLKNADMNTRKEYSRTLLQFAVKQSKLAFIVSFGETNTESRIKNILKFRKPPVMISMVLILIIAVCAVCFLTVPGIKAASNRNEEEGTEEAFGGNSEESSIAAGDNEEGTDPSLLGEKEYAQLIIKCLEEENRKVFSSLIQYPIQLYVGDQKKVIFNEEEFQEAYDQIVNEDFKALVLSTDPDHLQVSPMYGMSMGNGKLWFEHFSSSGYQIYSINNSDGEVYVEENKLQKDWTGRTADLDMSIQEKEAWYARVTEDFPHAEESYEIRGIYYEDMDQNGSRDLLLLLKLRDGMITPDSYYGAYLCIYMNEDPVYFKAYNGFYPGLRQVLYGDVDGDGYTEIIYSIDTGGNGGNGSAEKSILKYKSHTLMQMYFPGDDLEELEEAVDEGYVVKVLYGREENEYNAVCDSLGQSIKFRGKYAVDEDGRRRVYNTQKDGLAGGNCRGYTQFSIITKDGRDYLQAMEYLMGEGGTSHGIGWAVFLMDWDENGEPYVLDFSVKELE